MQVQCLGQEDPLEEDMATHSSVLAWRIPWTEEPDGLQPIGSQRVRYDWSNLARTHRNLWMWPYLETVFADVTRMRLSWMRVGPKFNDWHTHRKTVMWTKAEIWSHAPTSQKHQRAQKTTRSSEEEGLSPRDFRESVVLLTPQMQTSSLWWSATAASGI